MMNRLWISSRMFARITACRSVSESERERERKKEREREKKHKKRAQRKRDEGDKSREDYSKKEGSDREIGRHCKGENDESNQTGRRTHIFENEIDISIIISSHHIEQANDVLMMIQLLQKHDFTICSLSISRILRTVTEQDKQGQ